MTIAAIVLTGGRSSRMGADKASVQINGRTMLERVIDALGTVVERVVVVGPGVAVRPRPGWPDLMFCREDPVFGGPVAGLVVGLRSVEATEVLVLAVDLSCPDEVVERLLASPLGADGTALKDPDGWPQYLAARYVTAALRERLSELGNGRDLSVRRAVGSLRLAFVTVADTVSADMDLPSDLPAGEGR